MRDRIYWAFSDAPLLTQTEAYDASRPAHWGTHSHFHEIQDSALAGGALVSERNERVRAYYCADFEPENREFAYVAWDANDHIGTSFGHTLIDSGASRHSLGRLGMACAVNVRSIEPPLIMETANGDLAITLEGDVELADGTVVRNHSCRFTDKVITRTSPKRGVITLMMKVRLFMIVFKNYSRLGACMHTANHQGIINVILSAPTGWPRT